MTNENARKRTSWVVWVFAALGLAGVAAAIFIAITIANIGSGARVEKAPLAVADGAIEYRMGQVIDLQGGDLSVMTITSGDQNRGSGSYSGQGYRENMTYNLIFFNRKTRTSRKLLDDNSGNVVAAVFLPDQQTGFPLTIGDMLDDASDIAEAVAEAAMDEAEIVGAVERNQYKRSIPLKNYLAIVAQPNGETMKNSLLIGRLSDGKQIMTLDGIEAVERFWILSPTEVGLIVQQKGEIFYLTVNFANLSVTRATKIEVN